MEEVLTLGDRSTYGPVLFEPPTANIRVALLLQVSVESQTCFLVMGEIHLEIYIQTVG